MDLKSHEIVRLTGIKWTPSPRFSKDIIAPFIEEDHMRELRLRGGIALSSIAIRDYEGKHVEEAKVMMEQRVQSLWPDHAKMHVPVHMIRSLKQERNDTYRMQFHLGNHQDAQKQRMLVDREAPIGSPQSEQQQYNRQIAQESVYLDLPRSWIRYDIEDPDIFIDQQKIIANNLLREDGGRPANIGSTVLEASYWLANPIPYVVSQYSAQSPGR